MSNRVPVALLMMLQPFLFWGCASTGLPETHAKATANHYSEGELTDEAQVRVTALEYLIRYQVKPRASTICFVSLNEVERRELAKRLPSCKIAPRQNAKPRTNGSDKEPPLVLAIATIEVHEQTARVKAGYSKWTGAVFDIKLQKTASWRVEEMNGPILVD